LGERTERRVFIDLSPLRRSRDLRCLVLGELASVLGTQPTTVAVPYQVYQLTHSSLDVGLVSLAQLFPLIAGSLLGFRKQRTQELSPQQARPTGTAPTELAGLLMRAGRRYFGKAGPALFSSKL